ncbi:Translation initiation factor 1 (eIF-1/SUI1) [Phaffia rhodozyma]|uniref:Translation initiation factor 1 (EIF-1/SUI1) n=1 Tax=Phaffia rhodozyma TaxID=264483 RepID=A0A0F7SUM9_PHARH|nr:Translation initiation factor 1 (eIF-1/SUI1) [Phaffia rhodozyma]
MSTPITSSKVDDTIKKSAKAATADKKAPSAPKVSTPLNLASKDPFDDDFDDETEKVTNDAPGGNKVHIRIQQRNGRKTLTTLQGLDKKFDPKKILKAFKKEFACNGTVVEDEEAGQVIQLQGDQRLKIRQFLVESELFTEKEAKAQIQIHGH